MVDRYIWNWGFGFEAFCFFFTRRDDLGKSVATIFRSKLPNTICRLQASTILASTAETIIIPANF